MAGGRQVVKWSWSARVPRRPWTLSYQDGGGAHGTSINASVFQNSRRLRLHTNPFWDNRVSLLGDEVLGIKEASGAQCALA